MPSSYRTCDIQEDHPGSPTSSSGYNSIHPDDDLLDLEELEPELSDHMSDLANDGDLDSEGSI